MKPKYFIFDFDGTLVDTHTLIIEAFVRTGLEYSVDVDRNWICENMGMELSKMLRHLIPNENIVETTSIFREYQLKYLMNLDFFPDVLNTLIKLKAEGHRMSILTQKSNSTINKYLNTKGVREMFDYVIGGDDVAKPKPDPEGLFKLAELYQTDIQNLIMVGDSYADIETGQNAGCVTIVVTHNGKKFSQRVLNLGPSYLVEEFEELLTI
jgi:HAD superfamily hydrolase (TIGR01549 family)